MRVAIVGGGISGLSLAEELVRRGADPVVFESEERVGGKIGTLRRDGFLLETGPNGFMDKLPDARELAERVGIGASLRAATAEAKERWLYLRGGLRRVPTTPPAFFRSDLLPLHAKLRLALEPLTPRPSGAEESVADFGRRHLGARATRDLIGAMVLGIYGGDVERLSLPAAFPRMAEMERQHRSLVLAMMAMRKAGGGGGGPAGPSGVLTSSEGGLGRYVSAIAGRLGERVRCAASVRRLERIAGGWRLHLEEDGKGSELTADAVVVTTPSYVTAELLGPLDPELGRVASAIPYAPMAVVHLAWPKERIAHPLNGFGFLVPKHEGLRILGCMFVSSFFPWRAPPGQALFTVMIGGAVHPELVSLPEEELLRIAREDLAPIVGAGGEPTLGEVVRWERAIPQYELGHLSLRDEAERRVSAFPGLYLGGNAWRGVAMHECIAAAGPLSERILRKG